MVIARGQLETDLEVWSAAEEIVNLCTNKLDDFEGLTETQRMGRKQPHIEMCQGIGGSIKQCTHCCAGCCSHELFAESPFPLSAIAHALWHLRKVKSACDREDLCVSSCGAVLMVAAFHKPIKAQ